MYTLEDNYKLVEIDLSDDTQVNSGGASNTQTLQPDAGYVYEIINMNISIPDAVGSTAGTHVLQIYWKAAYETGDLIAVMSATTGNAISAGYGGTITGDNYEDPGNAREQFLMLRNTTICSNTYPISFTYTNNLDANQTGTRTIKILAKQRREAL